MVRTQTLCGAVAVWADPLPCQGSAQQPNGRAARTCEVECGTHLLDFVAQLAHSHDLKVIAHRVKAEQVFKEQEGVGPGLLAHACGLCDEVADTQFGGHLRSATNSSYWHLL